MGEEWLPPKKTDQTDVKFMLKSEGLTTTAVALAAEPTFFWNVIHPMLRYACPT